VQLSASAVSTVNSTAWRLITGSTPGRPRQTGQVLAFGALSMYEALQGQNILLWVSSWA